jgi:hypothetical protein
VIDRITFIRTCKKRDARDRDSPESRCDNVNAIGTIYALTRSFQIMAGLSDCSAHEQASVRSSAHTRRNAR